MHGIRSVNCIYLKDEFIVLTGCSIHTYIHICQWCTNCGFHVSQLINYSVVVPNIFGFLVYTFFHVTLMVPEILRLLLDYWKIFLPLI